MSEHLSYLMGADDISDNELKDLNIEIADRTDSESRMLKIPGEALAQYINLIKAKLTEGFWNEIVGPESILFIFRFKDGHTEEYTLSTENEQKLAKVCTEFNGEPSGKTKNVYKYISDNEFYHDFMMEHYAGLINRK